MNLRKRVIGDLYLSASLIFIFLAFLYFGSKQDGWAFLIIGLAVAVFGIKTKKVMIGKESPKRSKKK